MIASRPARLSGPARAERLAETAPERALALYAAAAKVGDSEAAFIVGEDFFLGKGTPRHPTKAARWYLAAAEAGHVRAQCRLAHPISSARRRPRRALALGFSSPRRPGQRISTRPCIGRTAPRRPRAADAQAMLAYILSYGPPEQRDVEAAFDWYRQSAGQDCPHGQLGFAIALMVHADDGETVAAARNQLLLAAAAGLPTAHYLLGVSAERAVGTGVDEAAARHHYELAAEAGIGHAQCGSATC